MLVLLVVAQVEPASTVENQQVEDPPSMKFTWTIENFSRLNNKKHYSEVFVVGGYKWYLNVSLLLNLCIRVQRTLICVVIGVGPALVGLIRRILIFPKGNNVDHLSMYLDVGDAATLPYGWSRYAQFSLAVVNQVHNKYSIRKGMFSLFLFSFHIEVCMFVALLFKASFFFLGRMELVFLHYLVDAAFSLQSHTS